MMEEFILIDYDLEPHTDTRMNTFIKQYLIDQKGWNSRVPYVKVNSQSDAISATDKWGDTPQSTLLKKSYDIKEGYQDFQEACRAYEKQQGKEVGYVKGRLICVKYASDKCIARLYV